MGMIQSVDAGATDVITALITGLESEFGRGAGRALAEIFLAAEDSDFHWDARRSERFLGSYHGADEDDCELDRVAIVGRLDGV